MHDLLAIEKFDNPKYNQNPHNPDYPDVNGHNHITLHKIHPSLDGRTVRDAVEFLADHEEGHRKEHSKVRGFNVEYVPEEDTLVDNFSRTLKISFEEYITWGRPEKLDLSLSLSPHDPPDSEAE